MRNALLLSALLHGALLVLLLSDVVKFGEPIDQEEVIPVELVILDPRPAEPEPEPEPDVVEEVSPVPEPEPKPEVVEEVPPEPEPEPEPEVAEEVPPKPEPEPEPEVVEEVPPEPEPEPEPEVAEEVPPEPEPEPEPEVVEEVPPEPEPEPEPEMAEEASLEPEPEVAEETPAERESAPAVAAAPVPLRKPLAPTEPAAAEAERADAPETAQPPSEEINLDDLALRLQAPAEAQPEPLTAGPGYRHREEIGDLTPQQFLANLTALTDENLQATQNPELWEVIRAIRKQMRECWLLDPNEPPNARMTVDMKLAFDKSGRVLKAEIQEIGRMVNDEIFQAYVVHARKALLSCSPFELPADKFYIWRNFTMRFVPINRL